MPITKFWMNHTAQATRLAIQIKAQSMKNASIIPSLTSLQNSIVNGLNLFTLTSDLVFGRLLHTHVGPGTRRLTPPGREQDSKVAQSVSRIFLLNLLAAASHR